MNRTQSSLSQMTRRNVLRRFGVVTLGAGVLPLLQACGGGDEEGATPTATTAPPAQPTQQAATRPAGAPATEVTVVAGKPQELQFDPSAFTIPANTDVTVNLTNQGAAVHTFDIDTLNVRSGDIQPGGTATVKINAAPGTYEYYCATPGHKQGGMVGTLTVQ